MPWLCLLLTLALWVALNRLAIQSPRPGKPKSILDTPPVLCGSLVFLCLLALTSRPILSTLLATSLIFALWMLNRTKRALFHEPLNCMDLFLVPQIFRHPRFYLPYLLPARIMLPMAGSLLLLLGIFLLEPPIDKTQLLWVLALLVLAGLAVGYQLLLLTRLRQDAARHILHKYPLSQDPEQDLQSYGLLGTACLQALGHRHSQVLSAGIPRDTGQPPASLVWPSSSLQDFNPDSAPHMVLIQAESFFDLRELHPEIEPNLLPNFDALAPEALSGRMLVASHGAYTMRTEFSVLTGLAPQSLGLDYLNPYLRAARRPVWSLARHLGSQGYQTLFVSPFDLTFFQRHLVMPNLGFSRLYGEQAFAGAERFGPYISDKSLGRFILDRLRQAEQPTFIFAVSIEAHGPWDQKRQAQLPPGPRPAVPAWAGKDLQLYIRHLQNTDHMLGEMARGLRDCSRPAMLGLYGDHPGSIPDIYARTGNTPRHTPYILWPATQEQTGKQDLSPQELGGALLEHSRQLALGSQDN